MRLKKIRRNGAARRRRRGIKCGEKSPSRCRRPNDVSDFKNRRRDKCNLQFVQKDAKEKKNNKIKKNTNDTTKSLLCTIRIENLLSSMYDEIADKDMLVTYE